MIDDVSGVNSIVAEILLSRKSRNPMKMNFRSQISSSENEFDFTLLQDQLDYIHNEFSDIENESSDVDSDIVLGIRKIRITDNESGNDTTMDQLREDSR